MIDMVFHRINQKKHFKNLANGSLSALFISLGVPCGPSKIYTPLLILLVDATGPEILK